VRVESRHGDGRTTVGDGGEWKLRVEFPTAPCNEPFPVRVSSGDHVAEFRMKYACPAQVEFTAHQLYGSCGEEIPYDVFHGTAAPGATVSVRSAYGSGDTTVPDGGKWEIRVDFPDAPFDEPFMVTVTSSAGGDATFWFVRTGGDGGH
jgi:hypothetical protein